MPVGIALAEAILGVNAVPGVLQMCKVSARNYRCECVFSHRMQMFMPAIKFEHHVSMVGFQLKNFQGD